MTRRTVFATRAFAFWFAAGLSASAVFADDAAEQNMAAMKERARKVSVEKNIPYVTALRAEIDDAAATELGGTTTKGLHFTPAGAPNLKITSHPLFLEAVEAAAAQPALADPADPGGPKTKSLGGTTVTNRAVFPEVAIASGSGASPPVCSGVLIDEQTVLTAAHCVCENMRNTKFGLSFEDNSLMPAEGKIAIANAKTLYMPAAVKCAKGPPETDQAAYNAYVASLEGNDIALVRLQSPVPKQWKVTPRAVPAADALEQLMTAIKARDFKHPSRWLHVVGYGFTSLDDPIAGAVKSRVRVPILSEDCYASASDGAAQSQKYGCKPGREILSLDPHLPGKQKAQLGPCPGDSGGPAFIETTNAMGQTVYMLVGVVSRSINQLNGDPVCGDGAIYTLLTREHLTWIDTTRKSMASAAGTK